MEYILNKLQQYSPSIISLIFVVVYADLLVHFASYLLAGAIVLSFVVVVYFLTLKKHVQALQLTHTLMLVSPQMLGPEKRLRIEKIKDALKKLNEHEKEHGKTYELRVQRRYLNCHLIYHRLGYKLYRFLFVPKHSEA